MRRLNLAGWAPLLLLVAAPAATQTAPSRTWTWVNPRPAARVLEAVAAGPGGLVAVGDSGTILHSPDGISWTAVPSDTSSYLRDVVWTGSTFVAAGDAGTVLRSTDGTTWEVVDSGITADLVFVTAGAGLLVAGGPPHTLLTSVDGTAWQELTVSWFSHFTDAVWTGSTFVAIGPSVSAISPDGVTWTLGFAGCIGDEDPHLDTSDGLLVAVDLFSGDVCRSEDGLNWTSDYWGVFAYDVVWTGSLWVASDDYGIDLSPDGHAWTHLTVPNVLYSWNGLVWTGDKVVGVGPNSQVGLSRDGAEWIVAQEAQGGASSFTDTASGSGNVVAVSFWGPHGVSSDGISWEFVPELEYALRAVAFGADRFVAVAHMGRTAVSADGRDWSIHSPGVGYLIDVAWSGESFVAVGSTSDGTIISSPDGEQWIVETGVPDAYLRCVAAGNDLVVAGGFCCNRGDDTWLPLVVVGTPGGSWEAQAIEEPLVTSGFNDLVWTGTVWLGSTFDGPLLASTDLETWQLARSAEGEYVSAFAWNGTEVLAVGNEGLLLSSPDGFDWHRESALVGTSLSGAAWHDGAWMVVGGQGTILRGSSEPTTGAPVAGFSPPSPPLQPRLPLRFTDGSTGQVSSRHWDFGDGGSSSAASPLHAFATEGTYAVQQTVCNDVGCDSVQAQVTVEAGAPVAALSWSSLGLEAGAESRWLDLSTGPPTSWLWSFGDGSTSLERNPVHTYAEPGLYTVHLAAANAHGQDASTARVLVGPPAQVPLEGLPPYTSLSSVASNGSDVVAVGSNGAVVASHDGRRWVVTTVSDAGYLSDVAWNGQWFVAVGSPNSSSRSIAISRDGVDWQIVVNQIGTGVERVAGNPTCTIALGPTWAFRSTDLLNWSPFTFGGCDHPTAIAASPELLIVTCAGPSGTVLESEDGVTWTEASGDFGRWVAGVARTSQGFLLSSAAGVMRREPDGTWVRADPAALNSFPPPLDHLEAVAGFVLGVTSSSDYLNGGVHWLSAKNVWVRHPDWPSSAMAVAGNNLYLVGRGGLHRLPVHPDPLPRRVAGRLPPATAP